MFPDIQIRTDPIGQEVIMYHQPAILHIVSMQRLSAAQSHKLSDVPPLIHLDGETYGSDLARWLLLQVAPARENPASVEVLRALPDGKVLPHAFPLLAAANSPSGADVYDMHLLEKNLPLQGMVVDDRETYLKTRRDLIIRGQAVAIQFFPEEMPLEEIQKRLLLGHLGLSTLNLEVLGRDLAAFSRPFVDHFPQVYVGGRNNASDLLVPVAGFDPQNLQIVTYVTGDLRIPSEIFQEARSQSAPERCSIFIYSRGIAPAKDLQVLGLAAYAEKPDQRYTFFDLDWPAFFDGMRHTSWKPLHERFEAYAEHGVDWNHEIALSKKYESLTAHCQDSDEAFRRYDECRKKENPIIDPEAFVQVSPDGRRTPDIRKICATIKDPDRHQYEAILIAIFPVGSLPPEDLKSVQDAVIARCDALFLRGDIIPLFETIEKLAYYLFESFQIVEERLPRMLHEEVISQLPNSGSPESVREIEEILRRNFPDEADKILDEMNRFSRLYYNYHNFRWAAKRGIPLKKKADWSGQLQMPGRTGLRGLEQ